MKSTTLLLTTALFLLMSGSLFARTMDHKSFRSLSLAQQVEVLKAYKVFFEKYDFPLAEDVKSSRQSWSLFHEAWASGNFDCFYAGWPSEKKSFGKRRLCTNPANTNPDYDSSACGGSSLQCNPLLFGDGLCASTSTQRLRNSAFSQCENKFKQSGRSLEDIAQRLASSELANKAEELFSTVDRICSEENPPICRSLRAKVDSLKPLIPTEEKEVDEDGEEERPTSEVVGSKETQSKSVATQAVEKLNEVQDALGQVGKVDCELDHDHSEDEEREAPTETVQVAAAEVPEVSSEGFPRITSRYNLCGSSRALAGSESVSILSCIADDGTRPSAGFNIRSKPGHPYFPDYKPSGNPERQIEVRSNDSALNDTYIYLGDYSGGPDSHNVKSMMFLIPRVAPPSAEVVGSDVQVKLSTGETVIFDARTGAVKGGALQEGTPDFNPNRHARKPPNVHYSGTGISIRLDHRFETPTEADPTAEIKQGGKSCEIPRERLFNASGKLKTTSDRDLLNVINQACPGKGFTL